MPTRSRKRGPPATRRRALELLASCGAEGCTGAIMLARGFTVAQMLELVRAGLATVTTEHGVMNRRSIKIARIRIVLQLFPGIVRVNNRLVLVGDGIKAPKRGKKMPAVKLLHQQSE